MVVPIANPDLEARIRRRLDSLTKPPGSLGRLEELALRVGLIQGTDMPSVSNKAMLIFCADHGVAEEGVSAYPKEVTAQMTCNFLTGGAAINVLARHYGIQVDVIDVGVDHEFATPHGLRNFKVGRGTKNFSRGPAMTRSEAVQSIETGIRLVDEIASEKPFLVGAGEMGIGNTSSATAMLCALTGATPRAVAGRGTGIDDATLERKIAAIERGLELNQPNSRDPLDVLSKVGGLEIGAMAGVILGAAAFRIPVVLDGFISGAAALIAVRLSSYVKDVLFASHLSAECGHRFLLTELGLSPLLDLQMRLGEGTGACIAMSLIEAAAKILGEMATFESARIAKKNQ